MKDMQLYGLYATKTNVTRKMIVILKNKRKENNKTGEKSAEFCLIYTITEGSERFESLLLLVTIAKRSLTIIKTKF